MDRTTSNAGNKGKKSQSSEEQSTSPRIKVEANTIQIRAESTIQSFLVSVWAETTAEPQLGALDILQTQSLPVP